ncbi:MAG TPA: transglutaminase family protein [Polyangiaceae bacterium]|nr:transglutaminase family protein [Polyangiaceae bacterium]
MSIRVALRHRTVYHYDRLVSLGPQVVRLRPAPHARTKIESYSLRVHPSGHFVNWQQDPHSNYLARLVFPDKTRNLEIDVDLVADLTVQNPFDFFLEPDAEKAPFTYEPDVARDLEPYLRKDPAGPLLSDLIAKSRPKGERTIDFLVALNQRVHDGVKYLIRLEPGVQTPEETLSLASGSCRDSAWLLVQALRHLGLAARFASGYLIQLVADVKSLDGPSGAENDFTDLHAWAEVYLPGAGWVGLDATSGLFCGEGHIPLACTPEPAAAAPVTGALDECEVTFEHEMAVTRIAETPRVTKPYTEEQWADIERLGHEVDRELGAGDVRLTMGGEPTFVSIDDPDGAEWNFDALGPGKRLLAGDLLRRLRNRFTPGAFLHFGQGKWYPGEQLPRWALGCYARKDGVPFWTDPSLVADDRTTYSITSADAERFIRELAVKLNVNPRYAIPGYEDVYYYLWREKRLPVNVNPKYSKLADELERGRLARVFEQGLGSVVGYALPLIPESPGLRRFRSGKFFLRSEVLFLVPGDSAMGYRLPIASLPWAEAGDLEPHVERDPFDETRALPPRRLPSPIMQDPRTEREEPPALLESAPWSVRTALCTEIRDGRLHVFLPPLAHLEDYIDVVEQVEATAKDLELPVLVEGYKPPNDPRLRSFSVTPDPGVIEVNVHPSESWDDLVFTTTALYEEARLCRLGTDKFQLDGRQTGTGGGNHITLGGPTAADSPFLRRPDLLRSLIGYWHDHPSLSYLFSGLFIGPTSQAPRVDEARHEAVYELEVAFHRMEDAQARYGTPPPWLVDRTFRNLLADVSGNTHRAEFCIDKLYSPDGPTGRLGLVELRGFEMPPHSRMSLAEQLLVRSLVARFWKKPYRARLPRWGSELHDRFLLPHFVEQDFRDVVDELVDHDIPMRKEWFDAHLEFRFPELGAVAYDGVELRLRRALEPWHVLAEESAPGGASRAVDSSLDRLQVTVRGAIPGRHAVLCNGIPVPLHPTGTREEAVAGVRYKAWNLPRALHPNVPVHSPIVFDVADLWTGRSLGGCTVHPSHPGGRAYDRLPVNSYEAESRRSMLFSPLGHTPGPLSAPIPEPTRSPDYPFTLDLRRYPG